MSNQKLGILAVVAAVMVLWAVVQARFSGRGRAELSGPAYLIQGLNPADIGEITVGEGDDAIRIERQDNQFVVVNEVDYPADNKQINDLISKALDIKVSESYTDNPENHEDLELTEANARHVVKFHKSDGSLLTGVIVGKSRETGQGTYVRLASNDTVYVADEVPWFRSSALDFVNQEIVSAKREDVNSVTVGTPEGGYTLRSLRDGDRVVMENMPADKKLKDSEAKSVLTAITGLRFEDVNKPGQLEGLVFDYQYNVRMDDTTEYRFKLAKKGDKTYLLAEAAYTDPAKVTINPNQVDSPEELKKKEAKLLAQEKAQRFTLRHKNWVYEIPDWKAKYLTMSQAALFEEPAKPAAEGAEASEPPAVAAPAEPPAQPAPEPAQGVAEPQAAPAQPTEAAPAAEPNAAGTEG